jgi:hypothetical protein
MIRRLQNVSTFSVDPGRFQQPDRPLERRRTEVHVTLRRDQILVAGQFLDRPGRRPSHRQVRAERMAQAMYTARAEPRTPSRPFHVVLHDIRGERRAVPAQHAGRRQMPMLAESGREAPGERHVPEATSFRCGHVSLPLRSLYADLPFPEIYVLPFQRHQRVPPRHRSSGSPVRWM